MLLDKIPAAKSIPDDFNVIIEIPANSDPVKYEINKDYQILELDRMMPTNMNYPANYGFVPNTLADDGDPADAIVITPFPIASGTLVRCRAIGLMKMEDESGLDNKIICLPIEKVCLEYAHINSMDDLSPMLLEKIAHFFENYKGLEKGKWVKLSGWGDVEAATEELKKSIQ